jgi:hypothetical protein
MKPPIAVASCFLLALTTSTVQSQTTINFEEFPFPSAFFPGLSFASAGFVIENLGTLPAEISPCDPPCASNGTQSLLTQFDGTLRFTHSLARAFRLESFDAAESFSMRESMWARQIVLTGNLIGGGTVQESFSLDLVNDGNGTLNDFQSFVLPPTFENLTSLTITGVGNTPRNDFSLDNLHFRVVPEPTTWLVATIGAFAWVLYNSRIRILR